MLNYKRHIDKKLLSLRLIFFILTTICFFAFKYQNENLGYFIAVVFLALSIIVVKGLVVFSDSFLVSKYYFFGLVKRTWQFTKGENINISSFGSDFGENQDISIHDDSASGIGCLLSIFLFLVPPKITIKRFSIEKFDETHKLLKSVSLLLDRSEFKYLQIFIYQPHDT